MMKDYHLSKQFGIVELSNFFNTLDNYTILVSEFQLDQK